MTASPGHRGFHIGMRWKLMAIFGLAFTAVFVFIAVWVFTNTTHNATERLEAQLLSTAAGGAQTIDGDAFEQLVTTVPAVVDPSNPSGLGFPGSPLYVDSADALLRIAQISDEAQPYTYFRGNDGALYFATSVGYFLEPRDGVTFRLPAADVVTPQSLAAMERGLAEPTLEPPSSDSYGQWMSAYTPIRNGAGEVVGALGVDYSMAYIEQVQRDVQRELYPVLALTYLVLLVLVLVVSGSVVRPLQRLTGITQRVADGEYDLQVSEIVRSRFPDEMSVLARSFEAMAAKVAQREQSLKQEVTRLRIEIDHAKREAAVKEITESDFFSDLTAKAEQMRRRKRGED